MKKSNEKILYSAADILNFLDCEHHTTLDLTDLETPLPRSSASEEQKLIQNKGLTFEAKYAQNLKDAGLSFIDIDELGGDTQAKAQATLDAMRQGADIIFQGHLINDNLFGVADFMRKIPLPSALGEHSYEVIDTKLSLSTKVRFVIQLAFYSHLHSSIQGSEPQNMYKDVIDMFVLMTQICTLFRTMMTWPSCNPQVRNSISNVLQQEVDDVLGGSTGQKLLKYFNQ